MLQFGTHSAPGILQKELEIERLKLIPNAEFRSDNILIQVKTF